MKTFYWWCLHCEQTFSTRSMFPREPDFCRVPGCDGSLLDLRSWKSFRQIHPNLPLIPVSGVVYGLYDFEGGDSPG